jgi:hypothetical protein
MPAKLLSLEITFNGENDWWMNDDGTGDPWISYPYRWNATLSVPTSQTHSSQQTREPYFYNGRDINVGDCIFNMGNGALVTIYSISFQDETTVTCVVEDFDRVNTFQNADQNGSGKILDGPAYLFEVHDGLPILFPMPDSLISTVPPQFFSSILSRFLYRKENIEISVDQAAHGLSIGDAIYLDASGYHKAQSNSPTTSEIVGYVTLIEYQGPQTVPALTPDRFRYRPVGPRVTLPAGILPAGNAGIPIYLSDSVAGGLTATKPTNAIKMFIKLSATTALYVGALGAVASGAGISSYYADKDTGGNQGPLYVTASATGITYTAPTGGNGLYIVNVPTGVVVYSAFINAADTDCKTGNILEVEFTYAGAERNNSNADATYANVQLLEKDIIADNPPTESTPLNYKVWLNGFYAQVIDIGSGSITYKMGQIQYRRFTLAFNF